MAVYAVQVFLPTLYTHNTSPSAYPPTRSSALVPVEVMHSWQSPESDALFEEAARASVGRIYEAAVDEGLVALDGVGHVYPNYALWDTPLEMMFGENVGRLREIKKRVDPGNVMGLAGGFKL